MIPALVLTAGLATRLRPLSFVRAKAALPVAGEPLARRILRSLRAVGVTEAVLNLHHLPHTITRLIGDGADLNLRVRYSWEMPVLGSAGGPKRALPLLFQDPTSIATLLIVNGDTLTDVDVGALVDQHHRTGALVTLAVVPNSEPHKYGGVQIDEEGRVTGFVRRGSGLPSYHFVGVQAAEAAAFASVPDDVPYESIATLYPDLIAARSDAIRAHVSAAEFLDIGTPDNYLRTSLRVADREHAPAPVSGARTHVHPTALVERSVLWDDVDVGAGALLRECIVCDGVRVPADTSWTGVMLRPADGDLAPGERQINGLAVCAL